MAEIRINLGIKAAPEKIYEAITTQEGLSGWWSTQTTAKPEVGFVNTFTFANSRSDMEVTKLISKKRVEWKCVNSVEEWIGTDISFDLEEREGSTLLRFTHGGWRADTDLFAGCTYAWALFMKSLKSLCETGTGMPN